VSTPIHSPMRLDVPNWHALSSCCCTTADAGSSSQDRVTSLCREDAATTPPVPLTLENPSSAQRGMHNGSKDVRIDIALLSKAWSPSGKMSDVQ